MRRVLKIFRKECNRIFGPGTGIQASVPPSPGVARLLVAIRDSALWDKLTVLSDLDLLYHLHLQPRIEDFHLQIAGFNRLTLKIVCFAG